ncbi:MAG: ribosome small subunit-dependent GTPase A [Spirochaetota bacterium]
MHHSTLQLASRLEKIGMIREDCIPSQIQRALEDTDVTNLYWARVIAQYKNLYSVDTQTEEMTAKASGKMCYTAASAAELPVVGDWVLVDRENNEQGTAIIKHILPRFSHIERSSPGGSKTAQILAANVDIIGICMAADRDYNLRRLERYLSLAWSSGAIPLVIVTKKDLCESIEMKTAEVEAVSPGVEVISVTSSTPEGINSLTRLLAPGKTAVFIGSSGVGKSTLINRLLGTDTASTGELRRDGKGRHTTSVRELYCLGNGAFVIDTPGLREIGLTSAATAESAFFDIETLATQCHFHDCSHSGEPGCAVQLAVEHGDIPSERLSSYVKLQRELSYQQLNHKQLEKEKVHRMFKGKGSMKEMRDYKKGKH